MNRRRFIGSAAAVAGLSSAAEDAKTKFYALEQYFLKNGTQLGRINEFMSKAWLPAANRVHQGPKIFLEGLVAPHMPQFVRIHGYRSVEEMLAVRAKLASDAGLAKGLAAWEAGEEAPYENVTTTLLEAAGYSPEIEVGAAGKTPRVFELRTYHSPTLRQLRALHERFEGPEIRIFHRSGVRPLLYTSAVFGAYMPNLVYLIPFADLAAREKAWNAFGADPEWVKVRAESVEKHGQISSVIQISLYRATGYSPVR